MGLFIAPGITFDQYDDSMRLQVFRGRTTEWILAHAVRLSQQQDGGIPALIIATAVFEPMGAILGGSKKTEGRFKAGFEYVFPRETGISDEVYNRLRGGLFHEGFIKTGLVIRKLDQPLEDKSGTVSVDPERFANAVNEGFQRLCDGIQSDPKLREGFDTYWETHAEKNMKPLKGSLNLGHVLGTGAPSSVTLTPASGNFSAALPPVDPKYRAK